MKGVMEVHHGSTPIWCELPSTGKANMALELQQMRHWMGSIYIYSIPCRPHCVSIALATLELPPSSQVEAILLTYMICLTGDSWGVGVTARNESWAAVCLTDHSTGAKLKKTASLPKGTLQVWDAHELSPLQHSRSWAAVGRTGHHHLAPQGHLNKDLGRPRASSWALPLQGDLGKEPWEHAKAQKHTSKYET